MFESPGPHVIAMIVEPVAHPAPTHVPLTQLVPVAHTFPQVPQLLLSVCSLTHAPLQSE
jgi:hypothetical protein